MGSGLAIATHAVHAAAIDAQRVVIGYNHDVPHRGRVYHVQSEDSGRAKGCIFTHVFLAGVIVATNRVQYGEATSVAGIIELLRKSHKSMMRKLVHGSLDEAIMRCTGKPLLPANEPVHPAHERGAAEAPLLSLVYSVPVALPDPIPAATLSSCERTKKLQAIIESLDMDNIRETLENLRTNVAGTLGVALVDYESGMCLGTSGTGLNLDVAAAGNMDVMKAKARVMRDLGIKGGIEDILITLESQYHIIRPVGSALFLYLALDRKQGNLALARHKLAAAASDVKV